MSEHWTAADWADEDDDFPAGADAALLDAEANGQLAAVSAWLAAAPPVSVPDDIASRVSAAIEAESATRAADQAAADQAAATPKTGATAGGTAGPSRVLFPDLRPPRGPRRHRLPARYLRLSSTLAVVCLALAGLGWVFSLSSGSQSSGSGVAGPAAGGSVTAAARPTTYNNTENAGAGTTGGAVAPAPGKTQGGASSAASASASAASAAFTITKSGTSYRPATLAQQVRHQLTTGIPGPAKPATPSAALQGCVLQVTGGVPPKLVDRATYDGKAAYVVATAGRAWVVGLGCTAARTEVVVSVSLAG